MVGESWEIDKEGACASSPVDDYVADVSPAVGDSVLDASSTDIDSAVGTFGVGNNSTSASTIGVSSTAGASVIGD